MSERHVARCDGPKCGIEADLTVAGTIATGMSVPGMQVSSARAYALPPGWRSLEGATFCSWRCVARYAEGRADHGAPGRGEGEA